MAVFGENARVCFVGDSITAQNKYVSLVSAYYRENLPELNVEIYSCGVSGGTAKSQYEYFEDDVLPHRPTNIFIMLGVNDSDRDALVEKRGLARYERLKKAYDNFKSNFKLLYEKAEKSGAEVVLMTPPPYAEYQPCGSSALPGGYALIAGYAHFVKSFAKENCCRCIDMHEYLSRIMQEENIYDDDRIHPNDAGHYHIAKIILESQGVKTGFLEAIPQCFDLWRKKDEIVRNIYETECMIIGDYSLPIEKKFAIVKDYIANEKWNNPSYTPDVREYFKRISAAFPENKPKQHKLFEEANLLVRNKFEGEENSIRKA